MWVFSVLWEQTAFGGNKYFKPLPVSKDAKMDITWRTMNTRYFPHLPPIFVGVLLPITLLSEEIQVVAKE